MAEATINLFVKDKNGKLRLLVAHVMALFSPNRATKFYTKRVWCRLETRDKWIPLCELLKECPR